MKILYFLLTHSPTCFSTQKRRQRNDSSFLFTIVKFIYTWGNFDWWIKVTSGTIKVTPSAIKVTPFDGVTLIGL